MKIHRVLIVGGSRGLGKGLADEFSMHGSSVTITVRGEMSPLSATTERFRLDLNNPDDGNVLRNAFTAGSFDAVVVNAGILGPDHQLAELASGPDIEKLFMTNAVSPVRLARQLLPLLRSGGVMAFLSSRTASIALNQDGDMELYRASKSALNSLACSFAVKDAIPSSIGVLLLHPGWVQTEMGGTSAPVTVSESVSGLRKTILAALDLPAFSFQDYLGNTLSW